MLICSRTHAWSGPTAEHNWHHDAALGVSAVLFYIDGQLWESVLSFIFYIDGHLAPACQSHSCCLRDSAASSSSTTSTPQQHH
jgi:hypothetical protein